MESIQIKGNVKETSGTKTAKAIRAEGGVPCVMYGKGEATSFSTSESSFRSLVYTPQFKVAEIELNGETHRCILKDVQFHPVTDKIMHADFLRLIPGHKLKVSLPVNFTGSAAGVKSGGKFLAKMRKVQVLTTPEALTDHVSVDVSPMELGGTLRVRDIPAVEGLTIMNEGATPIASVEIPRALRSAQSAEEKTEDEVEPAAE